VVGLFLLFFFFCFFRFFSRRSIRISPSRSISGFRVRGSNGEPFGGRLWPKLFQRSAKRAVVLVMHTRAFPGLLVSSFTEIVAWGGAGFSDTEADGRGGAG